MRPLLKEKRKVAGFVPFRKKESGEFEFFMQMRDENAPVHSNMFSLFGGGVEPGEDLLTAVIRETKEELEYSPQKLVYLSDFVTLNATFSIFIEEVGADFESSIEVREGRYGSFLTFPEMRDVLISPIALLVAEGMSSYLGK